MTILINSLLVLEAVVAVLMMFVILMQRPKSEGLGAAFGGGVTENIFGAQTTNVLTTITTWLASIFFIVVLVLSILYAHRGASHSAVRQELMKTSATGNAATPAPSGVQPLPPKVAAQKAAADAKAHLNPAPKGAASPGAAASPVSPADGAVGVIPTNAPAAPSASAVPSATP
jgi:preprotein translocase subunit SecG